MKCTHCESELHTVVNCPHTEAGWANRTAMRCTHCRARDHYRSACLKLWRGRRDEKTENDYVLDRDP